MNSYQLHTTLQEAILTAFPDLIRQVVQIQHKIDHLPDYPTHKQVALAIGISESRVCRYTKELSIRPEYLKNSNRKRFKKADVLELIIRHNITKSYTTAKPNIIGISRRNSI